MTRKHHWLSLVLLLCLAGAIAAPALPLQACDSGAEEAPKTKSKPRK